MSHEQSIIFYLSNIFDWKKKFQELLSSSISEARKLMWHLEVFMVQFKQKIDPIEPIGYIKVQGLSFLDKFQLLKCLIEMLSTKNGFE